MESRTPPRYLQRLKEISCDLGVIFLDDFSPLSPPRHTPSFRASDDEKKADAALAEWRTGEAAAHPQPRGLKRAFTANKRQSPYTYQELYGALTRTVDRNGSIGVAEVILDRFKSLGGDTNLARRASTSSFWRTTSADSQDQRGRLLQTATGKGRFDFVQLLAPYADTSSLDESLSIALEDGHSQITEILLRYGANAALYLDHFRNTIRSSDTQLLALLLRAPKGVPLQVITDGLLTATINGSLGAVLLLVQGGANGDHGRASALKHAVETGRVDLATAIVTGANPPSHAALNEAIDIIFSTVTGHLQNNHLLTEVLLCGGPKGNAANEGLLKATVLVDVEMMQLLLEYGVDINYNGAFAIGHAIQRSRGDLVRILLQDQSLSPQLASEAVGRIPRNAPSGVKVSILSMLLLHGASGPHCNELLITASESGDIETARLLLSFKKDQNAPSIASVDYNGARCLQIAASNGNHELVDILTSEGHPSKFSLRKAFPMIRIDHPKSHFLMVQSFLQAGAEGDEVNAALVSAISDRHQSQPLTELLVRNGAAVNEQDLIKAVSRGQLDIVRILLNGGPSASACSAAIPVAMKLHHNDVRFKIISLLLPHAVAVSSEHVTIAQAIINLLENSPDDLQLLRLLCQHGKADMNFQNGKAIALAIQHSNPSVLDLILTSGSLTDETVRTVLECALQLPVTNSLRGRKVEAILRRTRSQPTLDQALIGEVRLGLSVKGDLSVIQRLLSAGADVNAENGAPLCFAVDDARIMNLILTKQPTPHSLSMALPIAMTLQDPARYDLCEKLLKAGAAGEEISKALFVAAKEGLPAIPLMQLLLPRADSNHNEGRVFRLVIRRNFPEGLDLLLAQRPVMPSTMTKIRAFQEAMAIKSRLDRYSVIKKLLGAGIRKDAISDALITAVNHADLPLTELLLQSGSSTDHAGGQAVLAAASSGNGDILSALVSGTLGPKPTLSTLTAGFGGATSLRDRDPDAHFLVLKILLDAGLRGEAVDAALVEAVTAGDANLRMTELIYSHGASVEWQDGEAVDVAARSGSIDSLAILLGTGPSQTVLKRAYRSSLALPRDQRRDIIGMIMKAGKTIDKHVTLSLLRASQETPADQELIKLLVSYGVFDEGQAAVHAASMLDLETLKLFIESSKCRMFMTSIFQDATRTGQLWQSDKGLSIMETMLENGANGEAVNEALLSAVERCGKPEDGHAEAYLDLFLRYNPDVNYRRGILLQRAAQLAHIDLIKRLLPGATSDSKSMAFPYLFKSSGEESLMLQLIEAFHGSASEGEHLDLSIKHPDPTIEPILFMTLRMFSRKTHVLKALLEAGANPDQSIHFEVDRDVGPEPFTVLCWAIYQPEKKISPANIALLINAGANVNFSTKSLTTPVLLAVKDQRPDVLEMLIAKGAKVTLPDEMGISPLAWASQAGNTSVMTTLSKAGAEVDDGSLHDAARELRCNAMRVLIKHGHEADYPSIRHGGRSALAELCYKAVDNGPSPDLEEAIRCLIANDTDFRMKFARGKTIFHYALDSCDPVTILTALLKPLWKVVNEECYLFSDGDYTYSLTKYVEKGHSLGPAAQNEEVLQLLRNSRAKDRFWANSIDAIQPFDCCGAPQHIVEELTREKVREKHKAEIREDYQIQVEMKRYVAIEENKISQLQTSQEIQRDYEKARARERIADEWADQQLRIENRAEQERRQITRTKHEDEIEHIRTVGQAQILSAQAQGQARIDMDQEGRRLKAQYEDSRLQSENDALRTRLAIEQGALEDQERVLSRRHENELSRLKTRNSLVNNTQLLANSLRNAGVNQKQIGYVMGEV